jgi:hypothetical protein
MKTGKEKKKKYREWQTQTNLSSLLHMLVYTGRVLSSALWVVREEKLGEEWQEIAGQ